MNRQHEKHPVGKLKKIFGRLSIRRRITFAILFSFTIILPVVLMSLFYFSAILSNIDTITERDVKLGRMATDVAIIMRDIRRDERNYRMFGNDKEKENIETNIYEVRKIIHEAGNIVAEEDIYIIGELSNYLNIYSNTFDMVVEHVSKNAPREEILKKIRSKVDHNFSDFQKVYRQMVDTLDNATLTERDSVLTAINEKLDSFSYDLFLNSASSEQPEQPYYIQENLENSRLELLKSAQQLAKISWGNMEFHKEESRRIEARAVRNIVTVLFITGIFCIMMVTYLPRYIVKPITSLHRTLKIAEKGDYKVQAETHTNDEIGDLVMSYNQMLNRLQLYDTIKTKKISSQKRSMERLLEQLDVPICIFNEKLNIQYVNSCFARFFDSALPQKIPAGGFKIFDIPVLKEFYEALHKNTMSGTREFVIQVADLSGNKKSLKGQIVRDNVMNLESVIVTGHFDTCKESDR
ncbi:MAG: HAMP domain-containing protein [Candidatus Latescibacteria bacterium]|nr:HAMP domain-containing protein [Candidatus Latescibacterota bacterium]